MNAVLMTLETLAADEHFDRQLELVREHWGSVRHLWLDDPELPAGGKFRSHLPPDFWIGCGMPGIASIKPTDDDRFEFAEDGRTALIVPCYDGLPGLLDANPERHVEHLVDLVAVDLEHPKRFRRRRAEAVILGSAYLAIAIDEGESVPVFETPLSWLASGGAGVCVLDWSWACTVLLGLDLVAETVPLGERLETALKPSIWVRRAA